jgi:hypothetical protein
MKNVVQTTMFVTSLLLFEKDNKDDPGISFAIRKGFGHEKLRIFLVRYIVQLRLSDLSSPDAWIN